MQHLGAPRQGRRGRRCCAKLRDGLGAVEKLSWVDGGPNSQADAAMRTCISVGGRDAVGEADKGTTRGSQGEPPSNTSTRKPKEVPGSQF